MNRLDFAIKLSKLVNESMQAGLHHDDCIVALREQLGTEERMKESRRRTEASY